MTELYLIIPAVIIFLLFLPIILQLKLSFNVLTNTGVISVYIFRKNVLYYIFEIKGDTISLKNENETTEKKIEFDSPEIIFYKYFTSEVKEKLRLRFLELYYNIGLNDAFLTSMVCGYINLLYFVLTSYMKNAMPTSSIELYDTASFNESEAVVMTNVNLSISLFDLVYSLLLSVILTLKSKKKNNI